MIKIFTWLKGLIIVRYALEALKYMWPLILAFLLWPEINSLLSRFSWWNTMLGGITQKVNEWSMWLRTIPALGTMFKYIDEGWTWLRLRIVELFA